jgi:hypothetical protein
MKKWIVVISSHCGTTCEGEGTIPTPHWRGQDLSQLSTFFDATIFHVYGMANRSILLQDVSSILQMPNSVHYKYLNQYSLVWVCLITNLCRTWMHSLKPATSCSKGTSSLNWWRQVAPYMQRSCQSKKKIWRVATLHENVSSIMPAFTLHV